MSAETLKTQNTHPPYSVVGLEKFDFNGVATTPEIGRPVKLSDLVKYVRAELDRTKVDKVDTVLIWGYTLEWNYNKTNSSYSDLMINGKELPYVWNSPSSIVFYPDKVVLISRKGICINPHTVDFSDADQNTHLTISAEWLRDYTTNEGMVAYVDGGKLYSQTLDKSQEPQELDIPKIEDMEAWRIVWITPNNTVFYTMRNTKTSISVLYRDNEKVGDIPEFKTLDKHVLLPDGTLTLQLTLQNGQQMTKQIDTSSEPRYRSWGADARVQIARAATIRVLERNDVLTWKLWEQGAEISRKSAELAEKDAEIARQARVIADLEWDLQSAKNGNARLLADLNSERTSVQHLGNAYTMAIWKINRIYDAARRLKRWLFGGVSKENFNALLQVIIPTDET